MEEPTAINENIYLSDGHIQNEISHETERVVELSTQWALLRRGTSNRRPLAVLIVLV